MRKFILPLMSVLAGAAMVGCDTSSPSSPAQRVAMKDDAQIALERMEAQDPSLKPNVDGAYGYAIFPDVGKGAVGIGGASGKGLVYRNGQIAGRVTLEQISVGPQIGGDSFGELIIFQDEKPFNRLMNDGLEFGSEAAATIVKAGAAGSAQFGHGVQVYILPRGGAMIGASLTGQKFKFHAMNQQ